MPELPEVEVVRAGLARHVTGASVTGVEVLHPRPLRRDPRSADGFVADLIGRRTRHVTPSRQDLLARAASATRSGRSACSGRDVVQQPGAADEKHLGVRRARRRGALVEMRFVDQRMFGGFVSPTAVPSCRAEIAHIGRDPLDPEFDQDDVVRRMRRRTVGIKRQLLDQNLVSGIGNIYADEALWRARLHFDRPGDQLLAQAHDVSARPTTVMRDALGQGGTSFDALYVNVNGESGYFDRSLHAYGREGEPCDRCGTPIRRASFMNRSSYFCPGLPAASACAPETCRPTSTRSDRVGLL